MKSRKGLIVSMALVFGLVFIAFANNQSDEIKNNSLEQKKKILTSIGLLLEKQHYSPKLIDDNFSKQVFQEFLEQLDGEKNFFIQTDIDALKKYATFVDDEIHGADIKVVPAVESIYLKRVEEIIALNKDILTNPFTFTMEEEFVANYDKIDYPKNEAERKERWRKKLKYLTLERYVDLLNNREKLSTTDTAYKSDTQLEQEARNRVLKIMNRTFDKLKVNNAEDKIFNTYVNTIANFTDPHTDYFPPVEKRSFDENMSGRFYGIGAQLQEQDGVIKIASLIAGYPAWRSGEIEPNDIIVKVAQGNNEPVDITGYDITDAVKLIRGNKGTEVRLTIKKQSGTIKVVSLMRDEIIQDESYVRSAIVNEKGKKIGYIFLPDFYADFQRENGARCSEDVAKEIIKLQAENIEGLVIDLRSNGGGSLYEVVQMVGLFIKSGPVVQVKDKYGKITVLQDENPSVLYTGPLAVMVNGFSASASEIFAAAIQDYKRGIIIGTNTSTFGKGTVQKNIPIGRITDYSTGRTEFGAVKLTFQKFYRINGGSTQLKGVEPDIVLPDSYEFLKFREKDNKNSLPWDEIQKIDYATDRSATTIEKIIDSVKQKVALNQQLKIIYNDAIWLADNNKKPIPLNIDKYKEYQKLIKSTVAQIGSLTKLQNEMNITIAKSDNAKYFSNTDKAKGERYQAWLKNIKSDIYIQNTTNIVVDMIHHHVDDMNTASN
ncbi:MAG: carboxy terminal-processing peptidase [Chitinophagaceae bacterium]|nr:carboxy terminal-processing peptidase [Chitinophagaceae bacterium]MCW5904876.1 carboxy terminal-processing peptidase [Chitinophagaceae bacterium]